MLRPSHWLRVPDLGLPPIRAAARDLMRSLPWRYQTPGTPLECRRVASFGDGWLAEILGEARKHAVLTDRSAARLNHFLEFPRQAMSGWELLDITGRACGFGLLNVIPQHQGRIRIGKIVDCLLGSTDVALWHAAISALAHELASRRRPCAGLRQHALDDRGPAAQRVRLPGSTLSSTCATGKTLSPTAFLFISRRSKPITHTHKKCDLTRCSAEGCYWDSLGRVRDRSVLRWPSSLDSGRWRRISPSLR